MRGSGSGLGGVVVDGLVQTTRDTAPPECPEEPGCPEN